MPRFKLASSDVTYQLLDGEVVAIHFTKGLYFNLRGAAAVSFDALAQGLPEESLAGLFTSAPADAADCLLRLRRQFVEAHLLLEDVPSETAPMPNVTVTEWVAPVFETYTDMQQLLLADPIHDVGAEAWPRVASTNPGSAPSNA